MYVCTYPYIVMHVEIGGKAPRRAPFSLGRFLIYPSIYFSSIKNLYIYIDYLHSNSYMLYRVHMEYTSSDL